jgi:Zn-dependent protease with chaperone function
MDETIAARLFGPDSPATGEAVTLRLHGHHLEIRSTRGAQSLSLASMRLREVVSTQSGLEFSWDGPRGASAVQIHDGDAIHGLRNDPALAGLPQFAALRARGRRNHVGRTIGWSAVAVFVLLPVLLLLLLFWQSDRIAGAIAGRIPVAQEQQFGRRVFQAMRGSLRLQDSSADVELVRSLGARLTAGSRFPYEFHVAENPAINAFALPGGVIVVHTGLIRATHRPEELAGVLAHEVQHVEQRHSLKAMIRETGLRGLWAAVSGDLGATLAGQAALQLGSLRFSRDAEREADRRGFETLVKLDIDPQGMVDFFGTMGREAKNSPPAWLSTHPASEARQQSLRAMREALGNRQFPSLVAAP